MIKTVSISTKKNSMKLYYYIITVMYSLYIYIIIICDYHRFHLKNMYKAYSAMLNHVHT